MADRYDTIAERKRQWEAIDRMPPIDDVFRKHVEDLLRARGNEPRASDYEPKAWRRDVCD